MAADEPNKIYRELFGVVLIFVGLFMLLSLVTFNLGDPYHNQVVSKGYEIQNGAGVVGAYLSGFFVDFLGVGAYAFTLAFLVVGLQKFLRALALPWWRWGGLALFTLCIMIFSSSQWGQAHVAVGAVAGGGFIGRTFYSMGQNYLSPTGALLIWWLLFLTSVQFLAGLTWTELVQFCKSRFGDLVLKHTERQARKQKLASRKKSEIDPAETENRAGGIPDVTPADKDAIESIDPPLLYVDNQDELSTQADEPMNLDDPVSPPVGKVAPQAPVTEEAVQDDSAPIPYVDPVESLPDYMDEVFTDGEAKPKPKPKRKNKLLHAAIGKKSLPTLALLTPIDKKAQAVPMDALQASANALQTCLKDFGIQGDVQGFTPGPVVTMFEFKPAPGVKVSRIVGLSDDIALTLKALAVRIEAPIPGKDSVGIEIPSSKRQTVELQELLDSNAFKKSSSLLTLALGKDIAGRPRVADLAKMPHLLVAGATGAGKSVCLNSILLSLLYKAKPEELKLLLIDPKRIELSVYADLPHLVHPVVTDMSQAKNALDWAVHEMERRYDSMSKLGVRNMQGYNTKLKQLRAKAKSEQPEELAELEPLPFLVIIIDELADLMMTAAKEVEMSVVRLAQLARAAGIHLILATQRPSVDVVTGLIKANFPCRISFQVTSKHDSRTILDQVGAEYLLGKGDMLFKPGGGRLQRMHGAFISDEDVVSVVDFWKAQQQPDYSLDFANWQKEDESGVLGGGAGGLDDDPLYQQAVDFVTTQGKASISLLQRRFRIGFNRSARFVEQMEMDGIIGPADGSKPRTVLVGKEL